MIYRFLDFELDEAGLELRRAGASVAMQARVLRALIFLVKNRERVVSKDELCDAVWQDMVVSDAALAQVIMHVRKALGDEGEQQSLLKTVRGRGFRFVAGQVDVLAGEQCVASQPLMVQPAQHALIGRSSELQALERFVEQAQKARGACVLIAGEPGIGKSSLVEALALDAAARGAEVTWGKAWEDGGAPPFWPFIQVLRTLVERHGLQRLERASGPCWHELSALMSQAHTDATDADASPSKLSALAQGSAATRFRLFDAMARLLRALSTDHKPTQLLILEDLHACDDASLSLLRYLNRELSGAALLIVGTFRDLALAQLPALRSLVDSVAASQRLQLNALAASDCEELLCRNLSEPPSQRIAKAVYELSGGNPLCIAELARNISQGKLSALAQPFSLQNAVPERIGHAVRLQLSAFPEPSVEALRYASVLGRSFAQPFLAQLLAITELELLERLHPALVSGLLRPSVDAREQLSFAHALVRNAVYAELSSHRRAQLHQHIAESLEARAEPALLPLHELAHHFYLAAGSGGRQKAIEYAVRAAQHAAEMRAHETAAELQERAYALSALEGVAVHEQMGRAFAAGAACYAAGQLERAVSYYDRAAEIARQLQDHETRAYAVGLSGFVLRGTIMFDRARQRLLREVLLALPEGDLPIKAILLPVSTMGETGSNGLAQRRAAAQAGIDMARRIGHADVLARTLSSTHHALWGAAPPVELDAISQELLQIARGCDGEVLLDALLWRVCNTVELGDGLALEGSVTEYLAQLENHHSGWHRYMGAILKFVQVSCEGDFARADHLSQRAAELGLQQHEPSARAFLAVRSLFRFLDGRTDGEVLGFELDPPSDLPPGYSVFWILAWVRCGRELQARAALAAAKQRGFHNLPLDPLRRPTLATYGLCAVELGERELAQELYTLLLEHEGASVHLQAGVYFGPIAYFLARLAASLERPSLAAQHFEAALVACQKMRSCGSLWAVQTSYARMLIALARQGASVALDGRSIVPQLRAAELLDSANTLCQELSCEPWQRQTHALRRELEVLPPRLSQVAG